MKALYIFSLLLVLGLSGCLAPTTRQIKPDVDKLAAEKQKQLELALQYRSRLQQRLANTSYPLLQAASVLCPDDHKRTTGMLITTRDHYSKEFQPVAERLYNVSENLLILNVAPDSPAAHAGIQSGDELKKINGTSLQNGKTGISQLQELIRKAESDRFEIEIQRNTETRQYQLQAATICRYPVTLSESDAINAYTDGSDISVTKGMLRFAATDEELAQIIAHEIAHNAMQHFEARTINILGGLLIDVVVTTTTGIPSSGVFGMLGTGVYSKQFESEADYVGLYILARAGFDIDNAEAFWRRMATEHPESITGEGLSPTHPATPSRFLAIRETVAQIKSKQAAGKELLPDMQ